MSRSYKKPCIKENTRGTKKGKRIANRLLRRNNKQFSNGNAYKKYYCSWEITDYKVVMWKIFKHNRSWCKTDYRNQDEYENYIRKISRK